MEYRKIPFNSLDCNADIKDICCNSLMIEPGGLSCERYYQHLIRNEESSCFLYKKNHYCPLEKKHAEEERKRKEAAERKDREEKEAAERAAKAKEAFERLCAAAERGDANAQFKLGNCYFTGDGVTRDYEKAAEWLGKAAAQRNTKAKDLLAKVEAAAEEEKARKVREAKDAAKRAAKIIRKKIIRCLIGGIIGLATGGLLVFVSKDIFWESGDLINIASVYIASIIGMVIGIIIAIKGGDECDAIGGAMVGAKIGAISFAIFVIISLLFSGNTWLVGNEIFVFILASVISGTIAGAIIGALSGEFFSNYG